MPSKNRYSDMVHLELNVETRERKLSARDGLSESGRPAYCVAISYALSHSSSAAFSVA